MLDVTRMGGAKADVRDEILGVSMSGPHASHSIAPHLPTDEQDLRTVQELHRHKGMSAAMIYTCVLNRGGHGVVSSAAE